MYTLTQKKWITFIFYDNFGKEDQISYLFTAKFRRDLREKLDLKLPSPLKSFAALPCEKQVVKLQLYGTDDLVQSAENI